MTVSLRFGRISQARYTCGLLRDAERKERDVAETVGLTQEEMNKVKDKYRGKKIVFMGKDQSGQIIVKLGNRKRR